MKTVLDILLSIGNRIMPSSPKLGGFIFLALSIILVFIVIKMMGDRT